MKQRPAIGSIVLYRDKVYIVDQACTTGYSLLNLDGGGFAWESEESLTVLHPGEADNVRIVMNHKDLKRKCQYWLDDYMKENSPRI